MRHTSRALLAVLLCVIGAPVGTGASLDLRGTARAGSRVVEHAVVWLEAPRGAAPRVPARKVVLDQRNLSFAPHVLAVAVGTSIEFPNNDRVFHNVFSYHDGKRFDLGLYPIGAVKHVVFDRPGLSRIFCNIHPNMAAYVLAIDSPYFAVSGPDGRFTLAGVPPGRYTYHAWRPGAPELTGSVDVGNIDAIDVIWP